MENAFRFCLNSHAKKYIPHTYLNWHTESKCIIDEIENLGYGGDVSAPEQYR
jgi:hypothetical protein